MPFPQHQNFFVDNFFANFGKFETKIFTYCTINRYKTRKVKKGQHEDIQVVMCLTVSWSGAVLSYILIARFCDAKLSNRLLAVPS